MADQREAILARLTAVCTAVEGVAETARNRLDVSKLRRPAIVILDGAESFVDAPPYGRGADRSEVQRMELTPLIGIYIRGNDTTADGGTLLSLYRTRLLLAILPDATLLDLVGPQGSMRYDGATVAPPGAESSEYKLDMQISFRYLFRLADLANGSLVTASQRPIPEIPADHFRRAR